MAARAAGAGGRGGWEKEEEEAAYMKMELTTRPQPPQKDRPRGGPVFSVARQVMRIATAVLNVFTMLSAYLKPAASEGGDDGKKKRKKNS